MEFKVYCRYVDFANKLDMYIFEVESSSYGYSKRRLCTSLDTMEFKEYKDGDSSVNPTLSLEGWVVKPFLQAIANELKTIDIVAEGEPVIKNELASTKYHLEDMRKIVFGGKSDVVEIK